MTPSPPTPTRYAVGQNAPYQTIQAAWDVIPFGGGGHIVVADSYDPANEKYPIQFHAEHADGGWRSKAVVLDGQGMGVTVVGQPGTPSNTIEVVGSEASQYRTPPTIRNLTLAGGADGHAALRLEGVPFATVTNVLFDADGHGLRVGMHSHDPDLHCFGVRVGNCQAWNCGGDGFRLDTDAGPHDTKFFSCTATACKGAGFRLRGYNTSMSGCTTQLNHGWGVEARNAAALLLENSYLEGNARDEEFPLEVYARNCDGLVVEGNYFHGATPREVWHGHAQVRRGLTVHESRGSTVERNTYRGYADGFLALFDCEGPTVSDATNVALDDTSLWV